MCKEFLEDLLSKQKLSEEEVEKLKENRDKVEKILREHIGNSPKIRYAGSKAKHTMIKESYDLDIICYFLSDNSASLKDIYSQVLNILQDNYVVQCKKSAIRIKYPIDNYAESKFHIDVVPGKYVDNTNTDCFLYISNNEGERIKTNLEEHISYISNSGCRDLIKLAKLWKVRNNLEFKTFILEIFVIKIFENYNKESLASDFVYLLKRLYSDIETIALTDPANLNNKVSNLLSDNEKLLIRANAATALAIINENDEISNSIDDWKKIFHEITSQNQTLVIISSNDLSLGRYTHKESPPWRMNLAHNLEIKASVHSGNGDTPINMRYNMGRVVSNQRAAIKPDYWIKFRAQTNLAEPFETYWQVVNTGEEAYRNNGLRGNIFIGAKTRWERTLYKGIHWIECYIVKNGICYANDRFIVKIKH
ncbi:hypothetical protein KAU32_04670 [bacterium]|nr:hypothetical protein [bacterium]